MPRVVFVAPEMLPVPAVKGGAVEYLIDEVSRRLLTLGFDVTVISRPANALLDPSIEYVTVPWTRFERWLMRLKDAAPWRIVRHVSKLATVMAYGVRAGRRLQSMQADVVYVHNDPIIAWLLARRTDRKIVLHMHNDHLTMRALRGICDSLLRRVDLVVCVSKYIEQRAAAAFPAFSTKFVTIANATDQDRFKPRRNGDLADSTGFTFLYVGRLTPEKGVHVLIDAFIRVRESVAGARLLITGSSFYADAPASPYQTELARRARGHEDAISFSGYVDHERLKLLYSAADAVVIPSVWQEPSGLVVLEAMSSERCVLASRVGGIPELIQDGENGILVPPNDPKALADAMLRVVSDREFRARISRSARAEVMRRFTFDRLALDTAATLRSIL